MSKADEIEETIKSTESSINETCKLLQDIPFINKKSADEMFEKMGYKKSYQKSIYNKVWGILYENEKSMVNISFDMGNDGESDYEDAHMVCAYIEASDKRTDSAYITMEELQAINQKCRELGWLDE